MIFLKRSNDYKVVYKKKQAAEELMTDDRVDYIENKSPFKMVIHTKSIIPVTAIRKSLILAPIGNYTIELSFKRKNQKISRYAEYKHNEIIIDIKRKQGFIKNNIWNSSAIHSHIYTTYSICWGSAEDDINIFCKHKDWYWVAKTCLNLLEDFFDKRTYEMSQIDVLVKMQIEFMNNEKFTEKIKEKTRKVFNNDKMKKIYNKYFQENPCLEENFIIQLEE